MNKFIFFSFLDRQIDNYTHIGIHTQNNEKLGKKYV